jgi:RNA polymerase sigma factor (sigma-70 family)
LYFVYKVFFIMQALHDDVHRLYSDHQNWLTGWVRHKVGNAYDAADLVQDTFVRVLRHRAELATLREPRAYLTTIAKRLLLNHYRKQSLERAYQEALAALPEPITASPEQQLLILETLHEIDAALHTLPARARQAFLLVQLEHLTYEQVSERLDVSVRTVQRYVVQGYEQCLLINA